MSPGAAMGPLVTISIPAYRARFLGEALASAVAQTWPHREIIVSQDGDDPAIPELCARFPEVTLIRGPNRGGPDGAWANFDRCLAVGTGAYVKMLLHDDWLHPDCVARMIAEFASQRGQDAVLVASRRWTVDQTGRRIGMLGGEPGMEGDVVLPRGAMWWPVVRRLHNLIGEMSTVMIRRSALAALGPEPVSGFGKDAAFQRDLRLFLELNLTGAVILLHDPLSAFRIHRDQASTLMIKERNVVFRVTAWLNLVERGFALGTIDLPQYRHGLRQVERLRLMMIEQHPLADEPLMPLRRRLRELMAKIRPAPAVEPADAGAPG